MFWIRLISITLILLSVIVIISMIVIPRGDTVNSNVDVDSVNVNTNSSPEYTPLLLPPQLPSETIDPEEEYTIVPIDNIVKPADYEIGHLDLTDRSQGQYNPSWRDTTVSGNVRLRESRIKPIAKEDAMCDTVSEQEVTHTPDYIETTENVHQMAPRFQTVPNVHNFLSDRR